MVACIVGLPYVKLSLNCINVLPKRCTCTEAPCKFHCPVAESVCARIRRVYALQHKSAAFVLPVRDRRSLEHKKMVLKTELCCFSGAKTYPGNGFSFGQLKMQGVLPQPSEAL